MNFIAMKSAIQLAANRTILKGKKHSPEILLATGIAGMAGAVYFACTATIKAESIMDDHRAKLNEVEEAKENINKEDYSDEDYKKDLFVVKIQTVGNLAKAYSPAITLFFASTGCILGAHHIMNKRNVALMAAYKLAEQSFAEYRKRVTDELGADKDFHFANGTDYEQTVEEEIDPETGKKKKVKKTQQVINGQPCSMYARVFEQQVYDADGVGYTGSSQWSPNADYNATTLVLKNNWANEHLRANGYVFLNDIYEELGFPRTKAGQAVGWVLKGDGDNYISFGPEVEAIMNKTAGYLTYRDGSSIILDFNVDGVIWDLID